MQIDNKFNIGDEVVFRPEPEKKNIFVKSFLISQGEIVYGLTGIDGWHFDFELDKIAGKTAKNAIGFAPPPTKET